MELVLSQWHIDEIVSHAKSVLPDEACGLLFGHGNEVVEVTPVTNSEPSPVSYVFDPKEQLSVMNGMKERGLTLVGIFHSHPVSPPVPSLTDIRRSFFPSTREPNFPGAVYVIVGLSTTVPEIKAYLLQPEDASKVDIKVRR
jgi:proteasome lid subunit RPN8/RPN11